MAPLLYITAFFTAVFILLCACRAEDDLQTFTVQSLSEPAKRESPTPNQLGDSELLDIVLVASVDGKFHALNRTTGHTLWSMSSFSSSGTTVSPPSSLAPLVRTHHIDQDPDLTDDNAYQETYIIEPQSGDIYVMATPSAPLQRFPFSMSELVDMSPFSFSAAADDHRVFVGRKETSLLVVELETGNIKATIDSACPWDPFEDLREDDEVDLDELEGSKPPMSKPTEVFIGRTDYHITIHTRPSNKHRIPVQNLSFSTYGPNNQDNILQGSYRNTKDDAYIQSLPNGEIISFKARRESSGTEDHSILWGYKFNNPIVAIFDVLRNPTQHNTFVLLQPRPQLSAILPKLTHATSMDQLPHLDSAYIGLVEETGSLFAMSPDHFPLVVFSGGGGGRRKNPVKVIDEGPRELPSNVDAITEERKRREKAMKERNYGSEDDRCLDRASLYTDRRCLVGIRPLEGGDGDGPENRLKRLIDGAPTVMQPQVVMHWDPAENANTNTNTVLNGNGTPEGAGDNSGPEHALPGNATLIEGRDPAAAAHDLSFWPSIAFAFVVGALGLWFGFGLGKVRRSSPRSPPVIVDVPTAAISVLAAPPTPTLPPPEESPPPMSPQVLATKKLPPLPPDVAEDADESGDENENENGDASALPGTKRKGRRGRRAKKKKPGVVDAGENNNSLDLSSEKENLQENLKPIENGLVVVPNGNSSNPLSPSGLSFSPTIPVVAPPVEPSLVVSDHVLGYGSHGTVVYRGSLQGRAVAVKRLLQDFVTLASREVSILQESDDHPNVIRYYYQEAHSNFLYIALELCPATLADLIETPDRDAWRDIAVAFDPKRALRQIAGGLRHLHGLKLVHRDIKPQNILVSAGAGGGAKAYRMLISDFGLCKKLDVDQTSFLPTSHGAMAAGTVGWRAPEILRGDVKLDEMGAGDDASVSSQGSVASGASSGTAGKPTRLTKSVDIFALGCLFFYTLTSGGHPFGDRFEREANIMKGAKNLQGLERFGEEGEEAVDLISSMLHADAHERPDTTTCLLHPFFWDPSRRLTFLQDASDRFEIMTRIPKEPYLLVLERGASGIVGNDWLSRLDPLFLENLGKFRKYDGRSVQDLLRALRNKKHHYQDLPDKVKRNLGPMPEGFLAYFTRRFPRLFLHVHSVVGDTSLRTESMFRAYFELHD